MIPYLFSIGPFSLNMYGLCIGIGVVVFLWAMEHDRRTAQLITRDQLTFLVLWSIVLAAIGGRLFHFITYYHDYRAWYEIFALWEPGYSLLGSVLALLAFIPLYLAHYRIRWLPVLDLIGTYAPLLQSIARIGCFCAGCCYGYPSHVPWAVTYTHPDTYAMIGIACHPTQLYSSLGLLILFLILRFGLRRIVTKPGQLFAAYLIGSSIERIFNDFFRAEHYEITHLYGGVFSIDQLVALGVLVLGLITLIFASLRRVRAQ